MPSPWDIRYFFLSVFSFSAEAIKLVQLQESWELKMILFGKYLWKENK